jgi:nucleoside-diphosphate-sugar epimerase
MGMRRILVTGGTGFIGRHCLQPLLERGYEVHAVSSRHGHLGPPRVHQHVCDLLNTTATDELIGRVAPTHLLHFAWFAEATSYLTSPLNLRWLQASLALMESFHRHAGQRAVIAGTCAEYDWRAGYCSEGRTPLIPNTLYGTCKASLHAAIEAWARGVDLSVAWGHLFFVYGPGQEPPRLVPSVIRSLLRGEDAPCSEGTQIRDFQHVIDAASSFVALLDSPVYGAVNIASGRPVTVRDLVWRIGERLHAQHLLQFGARATRASDPPVVAADVDRLRNEVGWSDAFDLESGLDDTIRWWRMRENSSAGAQ